MFPTPLGFAHVHNLPNHHINFTPSFSVEEANALYAIPRILNKGKQRAVDLVDPRNKTLREMLQKAEYAIANAADVVNMDDDDDDDAGHGSASDSE